MINKAVILCGGLATRFLPICKSVPKEMLPILDKPILQYIVEELSSAGITDILIVLGRNKEALVNHFDKNIELEERLAKTNKHDVLQNLTKLESLANITFIRQIDPKGTAHGVSKAKNWAGDQPFMLIFGDELFYNKDISRAQQLINFYNQTKKSVIAVQHVDKHLVYKYGIIDGQKVNDGVYKVNKIVEKPKVENAPSTLSYLGPAILTKEIFPLIEKTAPTNLEVYLTDTFNLLAKQNTLYAKELKGKRFDIGNVEGFVKTNIFYALQDDNIKDSVIDAFLQFTKN